MALKDTTERTFYFKLGGETFKVDAGIHCLINLKKALGIGPVQIFTKDFNWADEETLAGLIAGTIYRQIRRKVKSNDMADVIEAVEDLINKSIFELEGEEIEREYERMGEVLMKIYIMSKWQMTPEEFIEALEKSSEEFKAKMDELTEEAKASREPAPEVKKKSPRKKSTGSKSKRTRSSSASKTKSSTSPTTSI